MSKSRSHSLADNTIIIGIGRGVTQAISLILLPIYTHHFAADEYGLVDLISTYVLLLAPMIILQLDMGVFRFLIDSRGDNNRAAAIVQTVLKSSGVFMSIATIAAIIISIFVSIPMFWFALASSIATSCYLLLSQIARGIGDNKLFAKSGIMVGVGTLVSVLILIVWLGLGPEGILLSSAIGNIAALIYISSRPKLLDLLKIKIKPVDRVSIKSILQYSVPLAVNGSAWWMVNVFNRTLVAVFVDTAANGIYATAARFPVFISSIFGIINTSWTESAALHIDAPDRNKFFSKTFNVSLKLFISAALLLITAMPIVFHFLINERYYEALNYIPIIASGAIFSSMIAMYSAIYTAKRLSRRIMVTSLASAAVSITLGLLLVPSFAVYGATIASSVAFMLMAIFRHFDTRQYVKITYNMPVVLLLVSATVVTYLVYYSKPSLTICCLYFFATASFAVLINKQIITYTYDKFKSALTRRNPR